MTYQAPIRDMAFAMNNIANFKAEMDRGLFDDLDPDLINAVLEEAGKFASEVIAPLNVLGDQQGAKLENGEVVMPDGWKDVYSQWVDAGWCALPGPAQFGGQELPVAVAIACVELWNSASMAFALNPLLTQAGVQAIMAHGTDALKDKYLAKLVSGEWTGTMQLTEPQSGSDLSKLATKAVPQADGTYKLSGTKIFITYGDHSLTDNIVHMVLARTPDGPPGTKGISLFLVPKFLVNEDGSLGERNDAYCIKLEEKIGIHASPTCVMSYGENGGATGWLIGEENRGLYCMLTMMNEARLGVGIQSVGLAERAYQHALAYAKERKQGRSENAGADGADGMVPIIEHPDIRRMLSEMKAKTMAARAICYVTANAIDVAHRSKDEAEKQKAQGLAGLLTPISKAYSSDISVDVASLGVQVHGGMGYVEETGAGQYYRDARINPIYEGTNGIQAIDLVTRKVPMANGEVVNAYLDDLKAIVADIKGSNQAAFGKMADKLEQALLALEEATKWILQTLPENKDAVLASATYYSRLFGTVSGGVLLGKGALAAARSEEGGQQHMIAMARFFAEQIAGTAPNIAATVMENSDAVLSISEEALSA